MKSCSWYWRQTALVTLIAGLTCPAVASPFELVTTLDPSQGPPAGGGGDSYGPVLSPDGRYVLFASAANNLVLTTNNTPIPASVPWKLNVYLKDRTNDTMTLVSVNLSGAAGGNGDSLPAALSANGRYALFESSASDLVPGDTNGATDVFLRDLVGGTTRLVSVSTNGGVGKGASRSPDMTPDGRYVAFVSEASDLVAGDTNGIPDVFVRDLQAEVTALVSAGAVSTNHTLPTGGSESPAITPDGRYVAFYSTATNLVAGVSSAGDIYVRDLVGETTYWASTYARTALQSVGRTANAVCYNHAISDDGQFVAYEASPLPMQTAYTAGVILRYNLGTGLTDLVHTNGAVAGVGLFEDLRSLDISPDGRFIAFVANTNGITGATTCICLWDAQTRATTLVSGDLSNTVPANSTCDWPALDASGRFVAFFSSATNLVTNTLVADYHVYLRDTQAATTLLLDADTNGIGTGVSVATGPVISADGHFVAFSSLDGSLVPSDRNHDYDVFVRDLAAPGPELVSTRAVTLPSATPNGSSMLSTFSVSTDGRFVAFSSAADNLVANDTNGCRDVFVRDLLDGTNLLASIATNGTWSGDGPSTDSALSADGRYVAFSSYADDLVAGDNNNAQDVFVRDLQSGTTVLVSINSTGTGPGNNDSYSPVISADGRFVLFRSKATTLAAGSFSGMDNLFLRDLQTGTTYALTTTGMTAAAMTGDGRYVAFGGSSGAYVWDSQAATKVYTLTTASAVSPIGVSPDGNRIAYSLSGQLYGADRVAATNGVIGASTSGSHPGLRFSGDGRFLAYAAPLSQTNQVYLYDFQTETTLLLSRDYSSAAAANAASDSPDISSDGRFVAYRSAATNVVPSDTNGVPDVFLYDRLNGTTTLLSVSQFGNTTADNRSLTPVFSGDAQTLTFETWGSDVVPADFNHWGDIIQYSLYSSGQIPLFSAAVLHGAGGQGAWVTWPVVQGKSYRVEFKNSLEDASWQDVSTGVIIVGNQGYLNDLTVGANTRFYRVVAY